MTRSHLYTAILLASAVSTAQAVPYGFFDARSVAMGNVSVATGSITTAALSNPAMLAINENKDSFAFLLGVGAQAIDNGGVQDLVDEYQVLNDQFNANPTTQTADAMVAVLNQMNNTSLVLNASANAALVFAGDEWVFAGTFRGYGAAGATIINVNTTYNVTPGNEQAPSADFNALGVLAQEVGFSVATKMNLLGMDMSVGVTPKNVSVNAITYAETISTLDTGNTISDAVEEDLGSFTTLDAGVALNVTDSITLGLVAKNLMSESLTTASAQTFNFDTHLRAGAAYHNSFLTLAADMDLTEVEPLSFEDPSKMLALGLELNAWDFLQLRFGYQTNQASGADEPDLLSAGIGLWLGFHLDAAVVAGEDSSLGAMVQLGMRF
jgi:hypothetical protein